MELKSLKELCEEVKVSRRQVQCFEKTGLLTPTDKNKYGHLRYDSNAIHRAKKIKFFQELEFTLSEMKEVIDLPDDEMKEVLRRRVKELEEKQIKLGQTIQEAIELLNRLD